MNLRIKPTRGRREAVTVRNGYYTFSRAYPAGKLGTVGRAARRRGRKRTALHTALCFLLFCSVFCCAFFAAAFGLRLSEKEPTEAVFAAQNGSDVLHDGIQALYMPTNVLQNKKSLKKFIRKLRKKDCNAVVIDFKASDGRLLYASEEQLALLGKCSIYNNGTVRNAIRQFTNADIHVIARVCCFEDPRIAALDESLAVKYLDTEVPWLDRHTEDGGKPWLNPYSDGARAYLQAIVAEVQKFGVNGIILTSVCFPTGENVETAGFPGENGNLLGRNELLREFITSIKEAMTDRCFLLVAQEADAVLAGDLTRYDGDLLNSSADGIFVDTRVRSGGIEIDKRSKYAEFRAYLSDLERRIGDGQAMLLLLDADDAPDKMLRALKKDGFTDHVRYDSGGDY
ncbi:MAG: hypothetical protein IJL52_00255 [Clostridia bacterium]|nr:hypothetical protein [Clostridia bacterium]